MIRNYDREKVVDFAASHMDYGVSILIRRPIGGGGHNLFGFLAPLAPTVWICICLTGTLEIYAWKDTQFEVCVDDETIKTNWKLDVLMADNYLNLPDHVKAPQPKDEYYL